MVTAFLTIAVLIVGLAVLTALSWRRHQVESNHALIITGFTRRWVERKPTWVARWLHVDVIDLSTKTVEIVRSGDRGFICKDGGLLEVRAAVTVDIGPQPEDIIKAAQSLGCAGIANGTAIEALLAAKLAGAVAMVAGKLTAGAASQVLDEIAQEALACIGRDLHGLSVTNISVSPIERPVQVFSGGPFR